MSNTYQKSITELWHMCGSKVTFRSLLLVYTAANIRGQDYYQCPLCDYWHLTSKKNSAVEAA